MNADFPAKNYGEDIKKPQPGAHVWLLVPSLSTLNKAIKKKTIYKLTPIIFQQRIYLDLTKVNGQINQKQKKKIALDNITKNSRD